MPEIVADAAYATFINTFQCAPTGQDEVVRVINYLQWESLEHLTAMQSSPKFQEIARQFAGLIEFDPHECRIAHVRQA